MTIECAILGLLWREPMAGYDLKKRIQDSPAMPWSGNNNQVYKALAAMLDEGLVTSEVHHQDGLPSRKVYTVTGAGRAMLRQWLAEPPEMPEPKKPFLAQLSLANALGARAVDALLEEYERLLRAQLDSHPAYPAESFGLEAALCALVDDNIRTGHQAELNWTKRARAAIAGYVEAQQGEPQDKLTEEVNQSMRYEVIEKRGIKYLQYRAQAARPETIEATRFVADCLEQGANRVMLDAHALPEAFFSLRTGLAGEVMQKCVQYRVKAALVMDEADAKGKFKDMLAEVNRGDAFRSFEHSEEAERWLTAEDTITP